MYRRQSLNPRGGVEESKEACKKFEKEVTLVQDFGRVIRVMEKLVDIVHSLHLEIHDAFDIAGTPNLYKEFPQLQELAELLVDHRHYPFTKRVCACAVSEIDQRDSSKDLCWTWHNRYGDRPVKNNYQKLGSAGLALHYANIVGQIDTLVTRSSSVPPSTRDNLYQGLPPSIKSAFRSKLQSFQSKEELSVPQIKAEMEKTLQWLVPIATNTTKAHHGFGWVGEWANTGSEVNRKPTGQIDLIRIETLHHADKERTEAYILELVVWLHHLVSQSRASINGVVRSPVISPIRSPNQKKIHLLTHKPSSPLPTLTVEDQEMLRDVSKRKLTPGISKSQEFDTKKIRLSKHHRLSKSSSHSPTREYKKDPFPVKRPSSVPVINFEIDRTKALDVIDRVDDIRSVLFSTSLQWRYFVIAEHDEKSIICTCVHEMIISKECFAREWSDLVVTTREKRAADGVGV
ncbi:hypothetical protein RJ639_037656 [Escallonia herrerae]|uniref:DUF668 domain-containing protein n=1 Tax=Escallonia herrerae TaxID=1293975 RepID=A0AA89B612_9ASTE|nr:hypothetical protein RJ639_037656 [Escallonia herrerae]